MHGLYEQLKKKTGEKSGMCYNIDKACGYCTKFSQSQKKKTHKKPILDNSMYMRYLEGIIHRDSRIVISRVWWGRGEDRVAV